MHDVNNLLLAVSVVAVICLLAVSNLLRHAREYIKELERKLDNIDDCK